MEKYSRSLFFFLFRSFSYFLHVFLGTCVDSLNKLPHVIKYETITPQKRYKLSQTSTEPVLLLFTLCLWLLKAYTMASAIVYIIPPAGVSVISRYKPIWKSAPFQYLSHSYETRTQLPLLCNIVISKGFSWLFFFMACAVNMKTRPKQPYMCNFHFIL